jgi:hypothetical protein
VNRVISLATAVLFQVGIIVAAPSDPQLGFGAAVTGGAGGTTV